MYKRYAYGRNVYHELKLGPVRLVCNNDRHDTCSAGFAVGRLGVALCRHWQGFRFYRLTPPLPQWRGLYIGKLHFYLG